MNDSVKLLKSLTDVDGIAGHEMAVKELMNDYLTPVSDEIIEDNLGGIFGKKSATNGDKTLMVAGHLDEVGFIVTKIDNNGFLKFTPIGGWWNQVMLSQKVTITTDEGKKIRGIIGSKPPHVLSPEERKKTIDMKEMFIDIGVKSKKEAEQFGIEIGNMVTPYSEFETLANQKYLTAKAFDNRYGCALAIDVLQNLKNEAIDINLVAGANVQEEVGLRGAKVAANKIKPDLAIAIDVAIAYDTPGMSGQVSDTAIGNGPVVIIMDASNIGHVGFTKHIKDVAKKHNITVQLDTTAGGGTDAGSIHVANEGTPTVSIGVALRYMHSNVSVLHTDDYKNSVALVTEIVKSLNNDVVDQIIW
ncbi:MULTISPECIES: M42 family metallopeptidase [Staphylococcus]|uniref:Peptidase n=1 Tax=Staphylococcus saprophyticus TaxID=29385 RepID=A0A380HKV8_STASA|nr:MULTISPECIES: M42 family metallopeptidase [Staphylococcus]MBN6094168.1 M42 family metallopeptidase [Staphylococcus saprophyticus]MBN6097722.1 M42 family metallopeptidase [Staphylococcus saprophyticus]MBN6099871.1 M42 family metallopeptidase [Staphylococcus saprophyticus]MDW3852810.1 M42 family metallopeptidase [Staphylococcus saprophyticus]MDW4223002.1 M42 family metallopeptidase [Staphylococcus saprophyticus]